MNKAKMEKKLLNTRIALRMFCFEEKGSSRHEDPKSVKYSCDSISHIAFQFTPLDNSWALP